MVVGDLVEDRQDRNRRGPPEAGAHACGIDQGFTARPAEVVDADDLRAREALREPQRELAAPRSRRRP